MIELDIVELLRGKVRVPVNDGAGLLDGKDFFERSFPTSKAAMAAADEIERLRKLVRGAYSEGFSEGMREHTSSKGGKTWQESAAFAAITRV